MSEYSQSTVGGPSCSYATLSGYNMQAPGVQPPVPAGTVSGVQIVPNYSAPGYNTLMHGAAVPGCSGYFNIVSAYGQGAENCNQQYTRRLCQ